MTYYTLRLLSIDPLTLECCKWDQSNRPEATYKVQPNVNYCSCVATKHECKHVQLAKDISDPEFMNETFMWQWGEKTGWVEVDDMIMPDKLFKEIEQHV